MDQDDFYHAGNRALQDEFGSRGLAIDDCEQQVQAVAVFFDALGAAMDRLAANRRVGPDHMDQALLENAE